MAVIEILSVLVPIVAAIVAWFFGRSSGIDTARAKQQSEVLDAVREAREVERENAAMSDDDVVDRLRRRSNSR